MQCIYNVEDVNTEPNNDTSSTITPHETTTLREIRDILLKFQMENKQREELGACEHSWKMVALVLDRLFLIIFIIINIAMSLCILLNYPSYDDFSPETIIK